MGKGKVLKSPFCDKTSINASVNSHFQLRPPPPPPPPTDPWALSFFLPSMVNSWGWGLLSCQISGDGDKKRGQMSHPPSTLQLIFLDRTVEECQFKHFNGQFFVLINIFLCSSAILIKTSLTAMNSFRNMKGCSSNIKRNLIQ